MMTERNTPAAGGAGEEVALAREANRLYWESETSVNRIAEDLGLSKGALYTLVEPLATDFTCPECGLEMAYLNRTARLKNFLGCPACGYESSEAKLAAAKEADAKEADATVADPSKVADTLDEEAREPIGRRASARGGESPRLIDMDRAREAATGDGARSILAGATLIGVAAGLLIVGLIRRR